MDHDTDLEQMRVRLESCDGFGKIEPRARTINISEKPHTEHVVVNPRIVRIGVVNLWVYRLVTGLAQFLSSTRVTHMMTFLDLPVILSERPRPDSRALAILQDVPLFPFGQAEEYGHPIVEEHNLADLDGGR